MTPGIAVAVASLLLTMIIGFGTIMRAVGRVEQKLELVWAWYLRETSTQRPGGRRYFDPPGRWEAHDEGGPGG